MSCEKLRLGVHVDLIVVRVPRDVGEALKEPYASPRLCFGLSVLVSVPLAHPLEGHSVGVEERQLDEDIETARSEAVGPP